MSNTLTEPIESVEEDAPSRTRGVTRRERRQAGLTLRNVLKKLREMRKDDTLAELDTSARAAEVLRRIQADNPQALKAAAGERDWEEFFEALLAFLEKLIPILMVFFGM